MRFSIIIALSLFVLLSFTNAWTGSSQNVLQEKGLTTGQPGRNIYPDTPPGETTKLQRPYLGAPPLIPHSIGEFSISRAGNECLDCHAEGVDLGEGHRATKVPASHYINEYSGKKNVAQVVGIRYNCLQCHVPQSMEESPVSAR